MHEKEVLNEKSAPIINTDELRKRAEDIGSTIKNYDYNKLVPEAIKEKVPGKYQKFLPLGILAVFVLIFVFIISSCTGGYKKPLKYVEQYSNGNFKNVHKLAPEEVWEDRLDAAGFDDMDEYRESAEKNYKNIEKALEQQYGDNVKIKFSITGKKTLSDRKLDTIRDGLKSNYDISRKSVKKAIKIEYDSIMKGSDDKETKENSMIVVKIDGKWYPCFEDGTLAFG